MKCSVSTLLTLFAFLTLTKRASAQDTYQVLHEAQFSEPVLSSGVVTDYKTFVLDYTVLKRITEVAPESLSLSIPYGNGNIFGIQMKKTNIYAGGFSVETSTGDPGNLDMGVHYSGKLGNDPHSFTAFSFYRHCMYGMVATDAGNFNIAFLKDAAKNPTDRYVLYNDRNLTIANDFSCGTDDLPQAPTPGADNGNIAKGTSCKTVRQYLECDYQTYLDNGANLQNTVSWTTAMFNVVKTIYQNEQVKMSLSKVFVWSSNDGYPSATADEALAAFGQNRKDNFDGDIAQLISTKPESNGGKAWVDVLCQNYWATQSYGRFAYSNIYESYNNLPLWSWTVNCVTHETGHNLGSNHTHWCGWQLAPGQFGAIDSCYSTEAANNGACYNGPNKPRVGTIMSYCHLNGSVNLNLGFGPLPGSVIRGRVNAASCLGAAGSGAPEISGQSEYCVNDHIQLTASTTPGTSITWTGPNGFQSASPDVSIAAADVQHSGVYTASVNNAECSASNQVQVHVSPKPPQPVVSKNGNTLKCTPASGYDYQWYTAAGAPVGQNSSSFSPGMNGQYYVKLSTNGCTSQQSATFSFFFIAYASVQENEAAESMAVWPNPAGERLFASTRTPDGNSSVISIYDLSGRLMERKNATAENATYSLDVSTLAEGMYILEINADGNMQRSRFMVKH